MSNYDAEHASPDVHIGDELQVLDYPNYVTANIRAFKFQSMIPAAGGYLHLISIIGNNFDNSDFGCHYSNSLIQSSKGRSYLEIRYLHSDAGKRPDALFINYDLASRGLAEVNVEATNDTTHRFFGYISNGTVPQQDTCKHCCLQSQ